MAPGSAWASLMDEGIQDLMFIADSKRIARIPAIQQAGTKTLNCLANLNYPPTIEYYLNNNSSYTKVDIKNAILCCTKNNVANNEIIELLAFHYNKDRMKKIIDLNRKRLIWKYAFNWLTKPITNDNVLGIVVRLCIKNHMQLDNAPLSPSSL
jgi:hypothetical protein